MHKLHFFAISLLLLILAACDRQQTPTIPQPSIPQPSIPPVTLSPPPLPPRPTLSPPPLPPQPSISQPSISPPTISPPSLPNITFSEENFPRINFPEINFPNVKIQQGQNTTVYTLPADVLFDFDKSNLRPDAEAALQQISSSIVQRFPNAAIQINGHTDSVGSDAYNLELSQRRAESVRQWLITNKNMKPDQLTTQGLGETQPVAPNTNPDGSDNPQGRQQNRRVEIVVQASTP